MCIGVPVRVISVSEDGLTARVLSRGEEQQINLMMLEETASINDYLLVQVGGFAVEKIEPEQAQKALALIAAIEEGDYHRAAELY
ncbi:HypC/HybG/HupF family hydrogenase formation chaperone [Reinekea marinisedimentorum]|uniref:Hydrogenase expression/formation protein HypC n=1 Tax=Reinekea marinisedimentorum TaxID=230495 RepID=A0A4V2UIM4_9GAMM|nr:HypC/HybG/HupF family hydrogenase formation chaperone [Reinekea marinisedimentorum]TCS36750.1 hydrogenase expression/formation protein HypC [Reinekea marinisedimentorum]